jgi:hypothetical protein
VGDGETTPLKARDRIGSLFYLIAVPYIKKQLDRWYDTVAGIIVFLSNTVLWSEGGRLNFVGHQGL